jgi:DNA-binding response OmpR family regulator
VRRILVGDDDAGIRAAVRTMLETHGHEVREAENAVDLFKAIDAARPDVVLLDVHFGAEDGLAIGLGLRQEKLLSSTKIVFMTGTMDEPELNRLSRRIGATILGKPFDYDALARAVS